MNNKSSECNTRFDDTYHLYKYDIGIDYHHIQTEIERPYEIRKSWIISECNTRFNDTYHLCKYNIGINYHHIRKEIKNPYEKGKGWLIKVMYVILDLMTLTGYTRTI